MIEFVVRNIQVEEWQAYRDIRLRALKDSPDAFGSTYADAIRYSDVDWQRRLSGIDPDLNQPMTAIVAGEMAGLVWVMVEPTVTGVAHLFQMWVAPDARGRGIGAGLVKEAIAWARRNSCDSLVLEVTIGNEPATRLYEKLGFTVTGDPLPVRPGSDLMEQTMKLNL